MSRTAKCDRSDVPNHFLLLILLSHAIGIIPMRSTRMRFEKFSFGSIRIDGTTYEHDVVIDNGEIP